MARGSSIGKLVSPRRGVGLLATALTLLVGYGAPAAGAVPSSLVNTIDTSRWSPASPDPSGLAYDSASNRLLITDGEVEETSIYAGANYYEATLGGTLLRATNTLGFSREAVGVASDPADRAFFSDDNQRKVFEVDLGPNGQFDRGRDRVRSFTTPARDAEGVAYDPAGDRLFIADGTGTQIYVVSPVDGVFGNGNDRVSSFGTSSRGVNDPETVEFNRDSGTLFTIGSAGDKVVEFTTSGATVSETDTSYLPLVAPAGLAYAPTSTDPTKMSFYISDRGGDNGQDPNENDGKIYEVTSGRLTRRASGRLVISRRSKRASRRGIVPVRVACKQVTNCRGTLRLSVKARKRSGAKRTSIARRRFAVLSGHTATLRVRLNKRGRALLHTKRRLRVEAFANLRPVFGITTTGLTARTFFRLRAARRK